jgi:hypothetical protein
MRVNLFGLPLLPLHGGIHADDKRGLSKAAAYQPLKTSN